MSQRRVLSLALAIAAAATAAGCGLEAPDETSRERSPVQAAHVGVAGVEVRNAFVTFPPSSPATPYIVAAFINTGSQPDTLTGATTPLGSVSVSGGPVRLPPNLLVNVADPTLNSAAPALPVTTSTATPRPGTTVPVSFSFATAGTSAPVQLPVVSPGPAGTVTSPVPNEPPTLPPHSGEPSND